MIFISMRRAARRPWSLQIDMHYRPSVSIIVPTYNEEAAIRFKLNNLARVEYPKELTQIIVVDSNSDDQTIAYVNDFVEQHSDMRVLVVVDHERKGKSNALNLALKHCEGDVIIVSDADCFWPSNILTDALPYLADSHIGAVSGPKKLLNPTQSWTTGTEDYYLKSANLIKLGESKTGSTLLFEGGFSAYKKESLGMFDPYNTGSDDCGTLIRLTENGLKTIMVPDAAFFTMFPITWRGRINIKLRRAGQLSKVFTVYLTLLLRKRIKSARRTIAQNAVLYLLSPIAFILLLPTTFLLVMSFPLLALAFLFFLIPSLGPKLFEVVQSFFVLFFGLVSLALQKSFTFWEKPEDRTLLTESILREHNLI